MITWFSSNPKPGIKNLYIKIEDVCVNSLVVVNEVDPMWVELQWQVAGKEVCVMEVGHPSLEAM